MATVESERRESDKLTDHEGQNVLIILLLGGCFGFFATDRISGGIALALILASLESIDIALKRIRHLMEDRLDDR